MRVPVSWLRDYVAWDGSVEELAELLSMSGSEVEGIDWVGAPHDPDNLALFRVGRVVTKERHPNADKLWLCTVDAGEAGGGVHQIVCGADNFEAGDTVAVSLAGAVLENGLKLRKANLRGVESNGMMLSEQELGFEQTSPGIVTLPAEWPVGAPLADYLPVAEPVLEIEVTPNRPDCLNIYGVAREVAAAAGLPLAPPPIDEPPTSGPPAEESIAVEIVDPDLCARYGARVVRGVTVGESPAWLKARLTHAGMRPINNVVDVTNYVMLALGEPLHAFDAAKIRGGRLLARRAHEGEHIVTLDGVDRALRPDHLVIADTERALVIAGIFGAIDAEVDEHTTDLVLEAATFNGPNIMRTSKEVGWRSEASSRFEKGLDPCYVPPGLAMASRLFHELCGGAVAPGAVDVWGQRPPAPPRLRYRPALSDGLLGLPIDGVEQADILRRLECTVEPASVDLPVAEGEYLVTPPPSRRDLERPVDLVEEVGRIHGLENLPETLPVRRDVVGLLTKQQQVRRVIADTLAGAGLDEVVTYAFVSPDAVARLGLGEGDRRGAPVALANPMSAEQSVMRTTLLPGLLAAVAANLARQAERVGVFEQGRAYLARADGAVPAAVLGPKSALQPWPVDEPELIGLALCGPVVAEGWTGASRPTDFYTLKGYVERLLAGLGVTGATYERADETFLHPGVSAALRLGRERVGAFGLLRPDVAARFSIEDRSVYVAELALAPLAARGLPVALFE
ncbi:MAG TPA: phenylalanine--tRNA ligase subunit beta, partial [Thermoleophilia bacterium]|nr:phenylalanine--tRNA ligase subunit beta [Thermoleophilia bacterium]